MAKIVKPTLSNAKLSANTKLYNYKGSTMKANNTGDVNQSILSNKYNYSGSAAEMYEQTAATKSNGFISRIYNYVRKEISIKIHSAIEEIKGKIESFLSKFKVDYNPSTEDNRNTTDPHQNVEREQAKEEKKEPQQGPAVAPPEPKKEEPKAEEPKKEEQTQSSSQPEPKKEEPKKEEPKKEETPTPVTKPGQNASLTNELNNRKGEVRTGNGVSNQVRTDCKQYSVGGQNDNHYAKDGQLSAKERELLIYLAYHETGNDPVQATAVMSSYLNGWEKSGYSFNKYMAEACSKWSVNDEFANATQSYRNGTYTLNDVTSMKKYKELQQYGYYDSLSSSLDNVLAGTRNVNSTQWNGNGMYNTYTHAA